jgi:quinol monooxygenase YgiN
MIVIHSTVPFDPKQYEEARDLVRKLAAKSREEPGTVRYRAMADVDDEHTVRFFEQYEDEAAWRAHAESDHYQSFVDRLPDLVDGPMETINFVDVEDPHVHEFTAEEAASDD